MNLNTLIDAYCERTSAALLAEPLNLFSNIAFFMTAYLAHRKLKRHLGGALPLGAATLIGLTYLIGIGSSLFHSFATQWAHWGDIWPIRIFVLFYLGYFSHHVLRLSILGTIMVFVTHCSLMALSLWGIDPQAVNGSNFYFGPIATLFLLTYLAHRSRLTAYALLARASIILVVSLFFRTIDMQICTQFPYGSHFIWHLLNGSAIYLLLCAIKVEPVEKIRAAA